jgi:hypothetical protein
MHNSYTEQADVAVTLDICSGYALSLTPCTKSRQNIIKYVSLNDESDTKLFVILLLEKSLMSQLRMGLNFNFN